jgi:DNA-binding MarR family transcriptional regulator
MDYSVFEDFSCRGAMFQHDVFRQPPGHPAMARAQRRKKISTESLEQVTFLNLTRLQDCVQRELARLLDQYQLTVPQYNVLCVLGEVRGKGLPCLEVAKRLITRMPDVSRLVDRLAAAGLVERSRREEDRRVVLIRIKVVGRNRLKRLHRPVLDLYKRLLGHLGSRNLHELNRLLIEARRGAESSEHER